MTTATFELDVDVIPVTDPTQDHTGARAEDARSMEKALTPGTVNTEAVGIAKCHICCL